ncbi:signal peptidase I [Rhodococcus sp. (in: high G+C Gram-positive bacteria)]|uniref:signal peptidase I n=1 Tax=Rhodococcus sp. TaxID=1831 RepID=UPI003B8A7A26
MSHAVGREDQPTTVWWWVKSVASWLLLIAMMGVLALTIVIPRIVGATPYTVLTGSMKPTYPPGTLIVVRPQDPQTLTVGDPITFQWESGKPEVVTHRITQVRRTSQGDLTFVTHGDNNPSPDERPVVPEQVRGKVWYSMPYVGYINNYITGKQRSVLLTVVVGSLLIYAVSMFVSSSRDKARSRRPKAIDLRDDDSTATAVIPVIDGNASTTTK